MIDKVRDASLSSNILLVSTHLYKRDPLVNLVDPSVGWSVGRSVRPSVGPLVTLSSKIREINIFEQINAQGGILGALDTYKYNSHK